MSSKITAVTAQIGAAVVVPVALGLGLAAVTLTSALSDARADADSAARAQVARSVTVVRTEVRNELSAARTNVQAGVRTVAADALPRASLSLQVAITARDSGAPTLDDTPNPPSIVVPVYRGGTVPGDTASRRAAITGYRIVPLALRPLLATLADDSGGLVVRGPVRQVASYPGAAPGGARTFAVDMDITGSPNWDVIAWRPDPGVPAGAWFWAAASVLAGGLAGAGLGLLVRRRFHDAARLRALEDERAVVTGLAPLLQASLDVGEVVPAVSAHLARSLSLAGLSLSTPHEHGERMLFVWGDTPDPSVPPRPLRRDRVEPGDTFALALTRGGRALGVLRVVPDEPLTHDRLGSLATAGELLGSTLANAEAYTRQEELVARLRSVDEMKTVFLATASHELRTPVTAIVGFSTLLSEQWESMPPTRARLLVDRLRSNGQRLETLIEQLLDFSRIERGAPQTSEELFNLGATVAHILDEQPELTAQHRLQVVVTDDCLVRGSAAAVERIVVNLVGNAAKYSPAGGRITVCVRPGDRDEAVLLVDDEGSGVAEADRPHVFSRFFRGRGDTVTRTRGAGVGLAIVAEYTAAMNGTVQVGEAPGGGARFCVTFPSVGTVRRSTVEGALDVART